MTFNQYGAGSCENMIPKLYRVVKGGREGVGVEGGGALEYSVSTSGRYVIVSQAKLQARVADDKREQFSLRSLIRLLQS